MRQTMIGDQNREAARQIVEVLPAPDYLVNYQPDYDDVSGLIEAVHEVRQTESVTTPEQIDALKDSIATRGNRALLVVGNCHKGVQLGEPIEAIVQPSLRLLEAVERSAMRDSITVLRDRNQSVKPRSNELQVVDGATVASHMGDGVNGSDITQRDPDPSRMVAMAVQARDMEEMMRETTGAHVPSAHEALLLAFEKASVYTDSDTGQKRLLSADLPWIGLRTNNPNGAHVELLSGIENAVGVKLGVDTTREQLILLSEKLNPHQQAGKLVLMPRLSIDQYGQLQLLVDTIAEVCPEAELLVDMHGITRNTKGTRIRSVEDMITATVHASRACGNAGLRLAGMHVEAMGDDSRLECVNYNGELPTHPGNVDPQLNPRQLTHLLDETAYLFA